MRLKDILLLESNNKRIVDDFSNFVATELEFKSFPSVSIVSDDRYPQKMLSFGSFNTGTDEIVVYFGKRHVADVLRTLAHELVHFKQKELGVQLDGSDGSPVEDEANSVAGELMRKYRHLHPEIYGDT